MTTKTAYIYTLTDPRQPEVVRYVGKTNNPRKRRTDHIYEARSGRYAHKRCAWIRELLEADVEPVLTVILEVPYEEWEEAEQKAIADHSKEHDLLNMTVGGQVAPSRS